MVVIKYWTEQTIRARDVEKEWKEGTNITTNDAPLNYSSTFTNITDLDDTNVSRSDHTSLGAKDQTGYFTLVRRRDQTPITNDRR